ncbi:hypothetical protein H6F96_13440 [Microcoleus sp. FACHB-53]|nr:hypothetical protein [Microcoleus sp. FACHB-53]
MNRIILLTLKFSFLSNLEKLNTITKIPNPMKASHIARPIGNFSLKISILKNVIRVPTTSQTAARPIILGFVKYFTNFSLSSKKTFAQLEQPNVTKAEALQTAQLKIINHWEYSHPAIWSPFILIGNWL